MNNNTKTITILAAVVAIVGLGIGFAAFTRTLNVSSSATVTPANNFNVAFDSSFENSCDSSLGSVGSITTTTNTNDTISNLTATFTNPGQSVICTYQVKNTSPYAAYLKSVVFANKISCAADGTAANGGATQLISNACGYIEATVQVGGNSYHDTCPTGAVCVTNNSTTKGSNTSVSGHSIAASSGTEKVFVKITWKAGSPVPDGKVTVTVNNITLGYSTN